ncbi:hypothetical protein DV454_003638 [Geotrichum candidum]|nr:hypothetical protein DV454_003638 [Geotrichum candidum]
MSDSEEEITLSASTLAALQEFRSEQETRQEAFNKLYSAAETKFDAATAAKKSIADFQEDWNLSQFWYSDDTQAVLARELLEDIAAGDDEEFPLRVAIISAPSVYSMALKLFGTNPRYERLFRDNFYLLEFDARFEHLAATPDRFVHYDFNKPVAVPPALKGTFDRVLVDPPFLSEECQSKAAITARYLLRPGQDSRVIVCTGERMRDTIKRVYPMTRMTTFRPEHGNGLSNEFRCYASYTSNLGNWTYEDEN